MMAKRTEQGAGSQEQEAASPEIFITDDPKVIEELHARGEKEIAIREGREYVFRIVRPPTEHGLEDGRRQTDDGRRSSVFGHPSSVSGLDFKIIRPPTEDGGPITGLPSTVSGLDQGEKDNA